MMRIMFKRQADWPYFGQSNVQSRPVARQILIVEAPYQDLNFSGGDRRSYRWSLRRFLEEIRPNPIFRGHSLTVLGRNKWSLLLKCKSRY